MLWVLNSSAFGANLDPYLLHPADRPSGCLQVPGFFPLDNKIGLFYDYKTYQTAVPPVIDRHAQSFECGTQKGTLYFFLYRQSGEAEIAERFARGIFSQLVPAPAIRGIPNGFIVLSFAETPPSVTETLDRKLKGAAKTVPVLSRTAVLPVAVSSAPPVIVGPSAPAVSSVAVSAPAEISVSSPAPVAASRTTVVILSSPVAPALLVPWRPPVPKVSSDPLDADLSEEVTATLMKELECREKDLQVETREACDLISAFKKGTTIDPAIPAPIARVGVACQIDSFGHLNARSYTAMIGSGRPGEVLLIPVPVYDGVEDLEVQALITARRQGKAFPASNQMADRILHHARPAQPTLFPTKGISWVLRSGEQKKGFLRRAGSQWILIIVTGDQPVQQTRSQVIVAGLY